MILLLCCGVEAGEAMMGKLIVMLVVSRLVVRMLKISPRSTRDERAGQPSPALARMTETTSYLTASRNISKLKTKNHIRYRKR